MGGVFNVVNFHLYHYAGNNPVKYTDPDGREAAPTNDDGTPSKPPIPVPHGEEGTTWKPVPGSGDRPVKWVPNKPVKSPGGKGSQPGASWDPEGHWDVDDGAGKRNRYLPDGTPITPGQAHGKPVPKPDIPIPEVPKVQPNENQNQKKEDISTVMLFLLGVLFIITSPTGVTN